MKYITISEETKCQTVRMILANALSVQNSPPVHGTVGDDMSAVYCAS